MACSKSIVEGVVSVETEDAGSVIMLLAAVDIIIMSHIMIMEKKLGTIGVI